MAASDAVEQAPRHRACAGTPSRSIVRQPGALTDQAKGSAVPGSFSETILLVSTAEGPRLYEALHDGGEWTPCCAETGSRIGRIRNLRGFLRRREAYLMEADGPRAERAWAEATGAL